MFPNSAWIAFLRKYGPVKTNDNSFDELIERARRRAGVRAIELPAPFVDECVALLSHPAQPLSVVLTGDAGDGKTYHCRQIWQRLGGSEAAWEAEDSSLPGVRFLPVGQRTLVVVRDLSEMQESTRRIFFARLFSNLRHEKRPEVFLIAANAGQLHDRWQAEAQALEDAFPIGKQLWTEVESQLFGRAPSDSCPIRVLHLGHRDARETLKHVLQGVLEHESWAKCAECAVREQGGHRCPILENRSRLTDGVSGELFRERLADLVFLNAQNHRHFTVRQLFMLSANMILGHADGKDQLLRCEDVPAIHEAGSYAGASIYANVVGDNLRAKSRDAFSKLRQAGLGAETSNRLDRLLTQGAEEPALRTDYDALVGQDSVYGGNARWQQVRLNYLELGGAEYSQPFVEAIRSQRQRLFFTIPKARAAQLGLWELTVFHHAEDFLDTANKIESGQGAARPTLRRLLRGLNRVFTGRLCNNDEQIVLATSGHDSQARLSLLYEGEIPIQGDLGQAVRIVKGVRTALALEICFGFDTHDAPCRLDLTTLRFEFLSRVGQGALPSSFSLECHEDILAFKARLLRAYERQRARTGMSRSIRFLDIADNGEARAQGLDITGT